MSVTQITMMYELSKPVYNEVLRPLVVDAVKDSESEIDDVVLALCDIIFQNDKSVSQVKLIYELSQKIYQSCLRKLAIKAVGKTETEVNDLLLQICDVVFQYKE